MKCAFRVDASLLMGTGHFVRCLTLARVLRDRCCQVLFVTREHPGHRIAELETAGFLTFVLPPPPPAPDADRTSYSTWRGVGEEQDALETLRALGQFKPDWLIVDHYGLGASWERTLASSGCRLLAIDDLPDRDHEAALVLNQNFGGTTGRLSKDAKALIGPRFALMKPDYGEAARFRLAERSRVARIQVFLGGVDADNVTDRVLSVLLRPTFAGLEIDLVLPVFHPVFRDRTQLEARHPGLHIHAPRPHLADLLLQADLVIGAGGTSLWERLCIGVPSLVVALAENQVPACKALASAGLIEYLGTLDASFEERLLDGLKRLLPDHALRSDFSSRGRACVDGLGAWRIAEQLLPTRSENLRLKVDALKVGANGLQASLCAGPLPIAGLRLDLSGETGWLSFENPTEGSSADAEHRLLLGLVERLQAGSSSARPTSVLRLRDAVPSRENLNLALVTEANSWIHGPLASLVLAWLREGHGVQWVQNPHTLHPCDLCFYLGYGRIVPPSLLARHRHNLVVHESDLPRGRGWSPLSWSVLEGASKVCVSLIEAAEKVDSGLIYAQSDINLEGIELVDELRALQLEATLALCRRFVSGYPASLSLARPQQGEPSYYPRRTPKDSRLDPTRSLAEQFNLLRIVDNERYPAHFEWRGRRYTIAISSEPMENRREQP